MAEQQENVNGIPTEYALNRQDFSRYSAGIPPVFSWYSAVFCAFWPVFQVLALILELRFPTPAASVYPPKWFLL